MKDRDKWIDSLKGIAIIAIIITHTNGSVQGGIIGALGQSGVKYVQLFYILAGMLSYKSLHCRLQGVEKKDSLKIRFIWLFERYIRMAPLYYISLGIHIWIKGTDNVWLGSLKVISAKNVLAHLLFLHTWFPYYSNSLMGVEWYIGNLMFMYVLIAACYYCLNSIKSSIILWSLSVILCNIVTCIMGSMNPCEDEYIWSGFASGFNFFLHVPSMLMGIVCFFILKHLDLKQKVQKNKLFLYSVVIYLGGVLSSNAEIDLGKGFLKIDSVVIWTIVFAILIVLCANESFVLFNNNVWSIFGKYSYGIYLFHYLLIYIYEQRIVHSGANSIEEWFIEFLIITIVSLNVSIACNYIIEKPVMRLYNGLIN